MGGVLRKTGHGYQARIVLASHGRKQPGRRPGRMRGSEPLRVCEAQQRCHVTGGMGPTSVISLERVSRSEHVSGS